MANPNARRRHRPTPTPNQAFEGIPLALDNARRHLEVADLLASNSLYGPATAHLVFAIEEWDKTRVLGMLWLDDGSISKDDAQTRLFDHNRRHEAAWAKSLTSGPLWDAVLTGAREDRGLIPATSPEARWNAVMTRHPEALPVEWPDEAASLREAGLYVDMNSDGSWRHPGAVSQGTYDRYRPAVVDAIRKARDAFENHKQERNLPTSAP